MCKTSITLAAFELLRSMKMVKSLLVLAPLRVCYTSWPQEVAKWDDFKHLSVGILHGPKKDKVLREKHDVYLVNYEGLEWLFGELGSFKALPFDMLVVDESTKLKHTNTKRFKLIKPWLPRFVRRVILTGTPAARNLLDLFGQCFIMDGGQTLGRYITKYRDEFFYQSGFGGYTWLPKQGAEDAIFARLAPRCYYAHDEDWLKLPPILEKDVSVSLPVKAKAAYEQLEATLRLDFKNGRVTAANAGVVSMKCIAEGTEVLTDAGWRPIELLKTGTKVWDGVEYVSIDRLQYNGYKAVVECWGVYMTADHKVMTAQGWATAQEILNAKPSKRYDRLSFWVPDSTVQGWEQKNIRDIGNSHLASSLQLWQRVGDAWRKLKAQETWDNAVMRLQAWRDTCNCQGSARYVRNTSLGSMERCKTTLYKQEKQKLERLWRQRHQVLSNMAKLRAVLGRYGAKLQPRVDARPQRCEWALFCAQLSVGYAAGAGEQYSCKCAIGHHSGAFDHKPSCKTLWSEVRNAVSKAAAWLGSPKAFRACKQSKVYDLINSGPRSRFTVRGKDKVPIIVHNCRQVANGGVYLDGAEKTWQNIHDAKTDAVLDLVDELQGQPALITYDFRHDLDRLKKALGKDTPHIGYGGVKPARMQELIKSWNRGEIPYIIVSAASMAHGVDGLQEAGRAVIWHSLTYNFEDYDQLVRRLRRSGQRERVLVAHIIASGTVDTAILTMLRQKDAKQRTLFAALRDYWT